MKYIVLKPLQLPPGTVVGLDKVQAERRAHQLEKQKGNRFSCLDRVWFKAGETLDLDAPPKYLLDSLAEPGAAAEQFATEGQGEGQEGA